MAKRLAAMHECGLVHRDLKPSNIMWLPRENRWTVIDFGSAARTGEVAPLSFSLAYAAPEVVATLHHGERRMRVTPAVDAWAIGVVAFELLTGAPAFNFLTDGSSQVRLLGGNPQHVSRIKDPPTHVAVAVCSVGVQPWSASACATTSRVTHRFTVLQQLPVGNHQTRKRARFPGTNVTLLGESIALGKPW